VIPDSYRSNFRPFYLQPPDALLSFCSLLSPGIGRGIVAPPSRDGFRSWLRHRKGGLANASGRIEFNIVLFMDWSFASGALHPASQRRSYLQLRTGQCSRPERTFTLLLVRTFRRTFSRHFVPGPKGHAVWTFQRLTRWRCRCVPEGFSKETRYRL